MASARRRDRASAVLSELVRRRHVQALIGITAIGAAIRFATLDLQSFWNDEVFTSWETTQAFEDMLESVWRIESAPPLYYALAWLWAKLFGHGEAGLRALSALAGTLTIPVAYAAASTLVSRRAGLLTAALAATSPFLVWYSQEARPYSLAVLLSSLGFLFFVRAVRQANRRDVVLWAVCSVAVVATHYMAGFIVLTEACVLFALAIRRREIVAAFAAVSAVSLLLLTKSRNAPEWVSEIPRDYRFEETLRLLVTPSPMYSWAGAGDGGSDSHELWWLAGVLLVVALASAIALGPRSERRSVILALVVGGGALVIALLVGALGDVLVGRGDYFLDRNVVFAWLPLAIVVAGGIGLARTGAVGIGVISALCIAGLAIVLTIDLNRSWQRDDWRLIASRLDTGSGAIIVLPSYQSSPLRYYGRGLADASETGARVRIVDVLLPAGADRSFIEAPPPFQEIGRARLHRWVVQRFVSPVPVRVPPQRGLLIRRGGTQ